MFLGRDVSTDAKLACFLAIATFILSCANNIVTTGLLQQENALSCEVSKTKIRISFEQYDWQKTIKPCCVFKDAHKEKSLI